VAHACHATDHDLCWPVQQDPCSLLPGPHEAAVSHLSAFCWHSLAGHCLVEPTKFSSEDPLAG
jgi:hypothetical protein